MIPHALAARRLHGKSGTAEALAEDLGSTEDVLYSVAHYVRNHGGVVTTRETATGTTIYDFSPAGERVCAEDGCGTLLSAYNPTPFCAVHAKPEDLPQDWFLEDFQRGETTNAGPDKFCPDCEEVKPLDRDHFFLYHGHWDQVCRPCRNRRRRERARERRSHA